MTFINSAVPDGVEAKLISIRVERNYEQGGVTVTGLSTNRIREARDRLLPALCNSGFRMTGDQIAIHLEPTELPKNTMAVL